MPLHDTGRELLLHSEWDRHTPTEWECATECATASAPHRVAEVYNCIELKIAGSNYVIEHIPCVRAR
jgi:hypothetical protein